MSSGYEFDVVVVVECFDDVATEKEAGAARGNTPAVDICPGPPITSGRVYMVEVEGRELTIRIRPQQITHRAIMRHLLFPVNHPDLIQRPHRGTQSPMHAKHPPVHNRPQTQVIKHVTAIPPDVYAPVFALTFVVEAVDLGDLAGFVITPDEGYPVGVADFEEEKEEEGFDRVEAAIHKVACRMVPESA